MPPPPNILIVEDERILAENLKTFLGRRAPNVRLVGDGEGALDALKTFTPDAIVMDYRLPGMNGLETYSEMLRQNPKKIDCVMITGDSSEKLSEIVSAAGIRSLLIKPFSLNELLEQLEESPQGETSPGVKARDKN